MTDTLNNALNKPAAVDPKQSLFFEEENNGRKKEHTSSEKLRIFQIRKSIWKEIGSIIKQKKDCSSVEKELLDERCKQLTDMDLECERELEEIQQKQRPVIELQPIQQHPAHARQLGGLWLKEMPFKM